MIYYVHMAVALSRPPGEHEYRRYAVEAINPHEARLIASQIACCTSVMPVFSDVVGDEAWPDYGDPALCGPCIEWGECLDCQEEREGIEQHLRPITPEEAKAMSEAMRDPDQPTRKLPPRPGSLEHFAEERARRDAARDFVDTYTNPDMIESPTPLKEQRERRNLFATLKRRWQQFGDWRFARRDPYHAFRDFRREFRAHLDGRESGPEGRER